MNILIECGKAVEFWSVHLEDGQPLREVGLLKPNSKQHLLPADFFAEELDSTSETSEAIQHENPCNSRNVLLAR